MTRDADERGPDVVFVVAGALDQRTGGYLYDARMVEGLRRLGRRVRVVELPGAWPSPDAAARAALAGSLADCADRAVVVVDGLVGGAAPEPIEEEAGRLRVIALVHHPLADEGAAGGVEAPDGEDEAGHRRRALRVREARTLAAARGVIVTSEFTAERVVGMGVDPARVRVVEPGTEPVTDRAGEPGPEPAPPPASVPTRASRDAAAGTPVRLLCVGSVVPRKDQARLLRALERLHARAPDLDWRCAFVGSLERAPEYAAALVALAADSPVGDRVEFTGEVDDAELERRWRATDAFVSASRYEGYGMALTEAMMRGLPVVAVEGGAVRCTVPPRVGRLVAGEGAYALADALRDVVSDPALRAVMAGRSREYARALPGWEAQTIAFDGAVRELARG